MIAATWIRTLALAGTLLAVPAFAQSLTPPRPPRPPVPVPTFPEVETEQLSTDAVCSPEEIDGEPTEILHFAKIRFVVDRGPLTPRDFRNGNRLNLIPRGIPLTVIIRHDPEKIHNVLARVLAFLRATDSLGNRGRIEILSAEYSTECGVPVGETVPPTPPVPPKPPKY